MGICLVSVLCHIIFTFGYNTSIRYGVVTVHVYSTLIHISDVHMQNTTGLVNTLSLEQNCVHSADYITDNQLDLLALTETWCTDKSLVSLGLIQPPGYSVIHLPRQDHRGGGVGLLYRDSYKAKRVKVEKFSSFEHQTVSLSCGTEQLLVTCVYLNSGVFTQDFSQILNSVN